MPELPGTYPTNPPVARPPDAAGEELLERLRAATRGEYDIFAELGRGGMATVYLAHEISLDRKVAIKVMSPGLVHGAGLVERFKREARTAANLSHPNIIPIYAVREVDGLLFCVIKLVRGTPLDAIMRELVKLPIPMVQAILAQVGDALAHAHRHGVVHRDIKPGNILIDDDGWAVVTDFGIAKGPEAEGLTVTGVAVGTPTYMSPEQCSGEPVSGASDQYSLGVVAYEMLAGRPPFTGSSMMALMYSHYHDSPPPLETLRPDCPAEMRDAVMRMLEKDAADRWPSMEQATLAMGARPLPRDDPTRSQLISLARTGVSHRIVSQVQTPRSPIPLTLARAGVTPGPQAAKRWHPALLSTVAVMLLGVGYLLARLAAPDVPDVPSAQPTVDRVVPGADSSAAPGRPGLPPVAGQSAAGLPPAAVTRRGEPPAPATAPAVARAASAVAPTGSKGPLDSATAQGARVPAPSSTGQQAPTTAAPPARPESGGAPPVVNAPALRAPQPDVASPPPDRPQPATVPQVDEQAEVRALILSFARALAGADLAAARRVYPAMPSEQREGLEALWKDGGTMTPRWTITDVVVDGGVATARIRGTNLVTQRRGQPSEVPVALRARLERRGTEWRLVSLVN